MKIITLIVYLILLKFLLLFCFKISIKLLFLTLDCFSKENIKSEQAPSVKIPKVNKRILSIYKRWHFKQSDWFAISGKWTMSTFWEVVLTKLKFNVW